MSTSCYTSSTSAASTVLIGSASTPSTVLLPIDQYDAKKAKKSLRKKRKEEQKIENAVYGYMQAIRWLDRDTITSYQISKALDLPYWKVSAAIERLRNQGIKINKIC